MDYTNLNARSFEPLLKRAGLLNIHFHDLRHTCATLLLSKVVHPKVVADVLGHASVTITLDTYSHALPDVQGGPPPRWTTPFLALLARRPKTRFRETAAELGSPWRC